MVIRNNYKLNHHKRRKKTMNKVLNYQPNSNHNTIEGSYDLLENINGSYQPKFSKIFISKSQNESLKKKPDYFLKTNSGKRTSLWICDSNDQRILMYGKFINSKDLVLIDLLLDTKVLSMIIIPNGISDNNEWPDMVSVSSSQFKRKYNISNPPHLTCPRLVYQLKVI